MDHEEGFTDTGELAKELGIGRTQLLAWAKGTYTDPSMAKFSRWIVSEDVANRARAFFLGDREAVKGGAASSNWIPPAAEVVNWEELRDEEIRLLRDRIAQSSPVGMHALNQFSDEMGSNDGLGMAQLFLSECIRQALPAVATKTAFEAFGNAFSNAEHGAYDVNEHMVWTTISRVEDNLERAGYTYWAADLCAYAASNWAGTVPEKLHWVDLAEFWFARAGDATDASQAAGQAGQLLQEEGAVLLAAQAFCRAADHLARLRDQRSLLRRKSLLVSARTNYNGAFEFNAAGDVLLEERRVDRQIAWRLVKHSRFWGKIAILSKWAAATAYWVLTGYLERPRRLAAGVIAIVLGFAGLYDVGLGGAQWTGLTDTGWSRFGQDIYLSIASFTTLGFGTTSPANGYTEILVAAEVSLGVVALGLFLYSLTRRSVPR